MGAERTCREKLWVKVTEFVATENAQKNTAESSIQGINLYSHSLPGCRG